MVDLSTFAHSHFRNLLMQSSLCLTNLLFVLFYLRSITCNLTVQSQHSSLSSKFWIFLLIHTNLTLESYILRINFSKWLIYPMIIIKRHFMNLSNTHKPLSTETFYKNKGSVSGTVHCYLMMNIFYNEKKTSVASVFGLS